MQTQSVTMWGDTRGKRHDCGNHFITYTYTKSSHRMLQMYKILFVHYTSLRKLGKKLVQLMNRSQAHMYFTRYIKQWFRWIAWEFPASTALSRTKSIPFWWGFPAVGALVQRSPTFLTPGTDSVKDNFFTEWN